MIKTEVKNHRMTTASDSILAAMVVPDAPGNEAFKFVIGWARELREKIRAQTENLAVPVLESELRQCRGALHILGAIAEIPELAHEIINVRAARAAEEKKQKQPEGKP